MNTSEFTEFADNPVLIKLDRTQFDPDDDFIKKYGGQRRPVLYLFSPHGKPLGYITEFSASVDMWIQVLIKKPGAYYKN